MNRIAFLIAFLLTLAACQMPPNVDIGAVVRDTVAAVDKSGDGIVTNAELKGAQNDPMVWIGAIGGLLGMLGLGAGATAKRQAAKVEAEVWDNEMAKAQAKIAALKGMAKPAAGV